MNSVIKLDNVSYTKSKGLLKKNTFSIKNISFELTYGFICAITGENGAGKSTLLEAIYDNECKYQGSINICGKDLKLNHTSLNQKIAYISEDREFFYERSAIQNAELLSILYDEFDIKIFTEALNKMELPKNKSLFTMSRGEFMRFQLAFSMAQKPALYLMDEVTAGMDPVFRIDFFKMLHEIIADESASVLIVTHIEDEITKQMDYVGIMKQGELISFKENLAL